MDICTFISGILHLQIWYCNMNAWPIMFWKASHGELVDKCSSLVSIDITMIISFIV